jgi:hypothetical protein
MDVQVISFSSRGRPEEGYLHILDQDVIPFEVKRVFYTMDTPVGVIRGRHAHFETEMVLVAVKGVIEVKTITIDGKEQTFVLNNPDEGLYLPKLCWHEMGYNQDAVQLVVCSTSYREDDYIRSWDQFTSLMQQHGAR